MGDAGTLSRVVIYVLGVVVRFLDGVDDEPGERERDEHHDTAGEELVQIWGGGGVHTEGASGTGGLDGLVDTGEAGKSERVVAESGHDPVNKGLI